MNIEILYQDQALLVINKPAGLTTLPDGYDPSLPHIKSVLENSWGRIWIVHRLDKDTSGILLVARTAGAHRSLNTQFEQHRVTKVYHALVVGNPSWDETVVNLPLRPNGDRQHRTIVDVERGKPAVTHLKVLRRFTGYSMIEAIPETGRTHQIRAHLSAIGHAIIWDKLYKSRPVAADNESASTPRMSPPHLGQQNAGMGLHARSLSFIHPETGEKMKFTAPYPEIWTSLFRLLHSTDQDA